MRENGSLLNVQMAIDDLADFMFVRNTNDAIIDLSLGGIQNSKDLFYFCLDLFCKGLVILFGNGNNSVNIDDLTLENFALIRKKIICAGIETKLNTNPLETPIEEFDHTNTLNFDELNTIDDNLPLSSYEFKIKTPNMMYVLSFEIVHHHSLQGFRV